MIYIICMCTIFLFFLLFWHAKFIILILAFYFIALSLNYLMGVRSISFRLSNLPYFFICYCLLLYWLLVLSETLCLVLLLLVSFLLVPEPLVYFILLLYSLILLRPILA